MTNGNERLPAGLPLAPPARTMTPGSAALGRVAPTAAASGRPFTHEEELQALLATQAAAPAMPVRAATPAPEGSLRTPTPVAESTSFTKVARDGTLGDKVMGHVKEELEEALRPVRDAIAGLAEQLAALSERMDAAGTKDDAHDGALAGLEQGLKDAEDGVKAAQAAADAAQAAADAVGQRLTEELGSL